MLVCFILRELSRLLQLDGRSQPENGTSSFGQVDFWVTVLRAGTPQPFLGKGLCGGNLKLCRSHSLVPGSHVGDLKADGLIGSPPSPLFNMNLRPLLGGVQGWPAGHLGCWVNAGRGEVACRGGAARMWHGSSSVPGPTLHWGFPTHRLPANQVVSSQCPVPSLSYK